MADVGGIWSGPPNREIQRSTRRWKIAAHDLGARPAFGV